MNLYQLSMATFKHFYLLIFLFISFAINQSLAAQKKTELKKEKIKVKNVCKNSAMMDMKSVPPLDTSSIERILGMKGKANNGEYKITIPQNDLSIMVDGFKIIPAMGLSTWIAFTPSPNGAMVMGDIIVTETDLKPVQE